MLIILAHNDGTGTEEASNYDCEVRINTRPIARIRVGGHNRADGWVNLLEMIVAAAEREE